MENNYNTLAGTQIASLFREINSILNQQLRDAFQGLDITPPQMMTLHYLYEHTECKASDIGKKFNLALSTVSSILDRMERNDLIIRERSSSDKRIVLVSPSEKAIEIRDSIKSYTNKVMGDMTQEATDEEITQIINGLYLMKNVLNRNTREGGDTNE